jgi:hypothetical protein
MLLHAGRQSEVLNVLGVSKGACRQGERETFDIPAIDRNQEKLRSEPELFPECLSLTAGLDGIYDHARCLFLGRNAGREPHLD